MLSIIIIMALINKLIMAQDLIQKTKLSTKSNNELNNETSLTKLFPKIECLCQGTFLEFECPEMDECPLNCIFGYAANKNGCEVCECQNDPCPEFGGECRYPIKFYKVEKDCSETNTCNLIPIPGVCPDVTCQSFCIFGFAKGKLKCPICKCNPNPCQRESCAAGFVCIPTESKCKNKPCQWRKTCFPICKKLECSVICKFGHKKDENGCPTCECRKDYCENIRCPANQVCGPDLRTKDLNKCMCSLKSYNSTCTYGLARDLNGCITRKCVTNPCQFVKCQAGYRCIPSQDEACLEKPCPYKAKCV